MPDPNPPPPPSDEPDPLLSARIASEEHARVRARRGNVGVDPEAPMLGVALSGGGIRSATVSLGVFQYLAQEERRVRDETALPENRRHVISRIDYVSSVSGGGYFATFFGSLFLPKDERAKGGQVTPMAYTTRRKADGAPDAPQRTPWQEAARRASDALQDAGFDGTRMSPLRWLRENGRYLAPNGGGDYLYAIAIAIRNWVGLHYVIGITLLALFLLGMLPRVLGYRFAPDAWRLLETRMQPEIAGNLWPSAWWLLALAGFLFLLVPLGIAFFLAQLERKGHRVRLNLPMLVLIVIGVSCAVYAIMGSAPRLDWLPAWLSTALGFGDGLGVTLGGDAVRYTAGYLAVASAIAIVAYAVVKSNATELASAGGASAEPTATTVAQTMLSQALVVPLIGTLVVAGYALIDTIGQSIYALWTVGEAGRWLTGGGIVAVLIPLLRQVLPLLAGSGDPTRSWWVRVPLSALALVAGVALFVAIAVLWSALAHGLVWHGGTPIGDPGCRLAAPAIDAPPAVTTDAQHRIIVSTPAAAPACAHAESLPLTFAQWAWLFLPVLLIAYATGRRVGFINLSTLQRYYAGHLIRSYLRASRFAEDPTVDDNVRNPARADDIAVDTYYHDASLAPLHLINVTLNQTVASGSQLVQRDRKGMNLALGPCGYSVGNRSYVRWGPGKMDCALQCAESTVTGTPDMAALPRCQRNTLLTVEPLTIGTWCAISGAAFTTGHGQGTTLGLSLLLGLTNVRLGYWWNTEAEPPRNPRPDAAPPTWTERTAETFRTQSFLANELLARYHGTRRSHWYLSDGGHFENTGAYELIRRRVPRIVLLDNGRDDRYAFDDVANLVRKARIDLDAEIVFFTALELSTFVDASVRRHFGTREELAAPQGEPVYATLAHIRYGIEREAGSLLMIVKPRVAGIEPLDILNYKATSPDFPQQSTTDQFYDEAQWESYRRLGHWMAEALFAPCATTATRWTPRQMFE